MIKKIRNLCLIFFASLLLTGCVKYEMDMQINDDKSMDFTLIETMDLSYANSDEDTTEEDESLDESLDDSLYNEYETEDEYTESSSGVDIDELNESMGKRGYKVETYVDPNNSKYEGAIITKHFDSIDDISKEGDIIEIDLTNITEEDFDDSVFFSVQKGLVYDVYKANFKILNEDNVLEESMASIMKLTFSIKLPKGALVESNATTVSDDKTVLTWELKSTEINKINFAFKFAEKSNLYMAYASVGIIALLIVIAIGSAISGKKRNKPAKEKEEHKEEKNKKGVDLMAAPVDAQKDGVNLMAAPVKNENIDLMATQTMPQQEVLHPLEGSGPVVNAPSMNMVDDNNQEIANNVDITNQINSANMMPDLNNINLGETPGGGTLMPNTPVVNESNGLMPTLQPEEYVEPVKKEEVNLEPEFTAPTIIKPKDTSIIENVEGNSFVHEEVGQSQIQMTLEQPIVNTEVLEPTTTVMNENNNILVEPLKAVEVASENIQVANVPVGEPVAPIIPEVPVSNESVSMVESPVIPEQSELVNNSINSNIEVQMAPMVEIPSNEPSAPVVPENNLVVEMPVGEPVAPIIPEVPAVEIPVVPTESPVVTDIPNAPIIPEIPVSNESVPMVEVSAPVVESPVIPEDPKIELPNENFNYNFDFGAQMANTTPNPKLSAEPQFMPQQGVSEAADYTNVFGSDFQTTVPVTNIPDLEPEVQSFEVKTNSGPIIADSGETIINQIVDEPIEKQGQ